MHLLIPRQLETDPTLLIPKSRAALSRYGHQLVIGNDLHRRKHEVVFVERSSRRKGGGNDGLRGVETPPLADGPEEFEETWLRMDEKGTEGGPGGGVGEGEGKREGEREIEELIARSLVERHQKWIDAGKK